MEIEVEVKKILTIYLLSQKAENVPPLGTILGNLGVNSIKFCSEFNEFTKELPDYITCSVTIFVYENKSFSFKIYFPPMGSVINLVKFEKTFIRFGRPYVEKCIKVYDVIQIALF